MNPADHLIQNQAHAVPEDADALRHLLCEVMHGAVRAIEGSKGGTLAEAVRYFAASGSRFAEHALAIDLDVVAVRERVRAKLVQRFGEEQAAAMWAEAASGAGPPQDERSKVTPTRGPRRACGSRPGRVRGEVMAKEVERTGKPVIANIERAERALQRDEDARVAYEKETARLSAEQRRDAAARASNPDNAAALDRAKTHARGKGDSR